jgi:hypothetical protein
MRWSRLTVLSLYEVHCSSYRDGLRMRGSNEAVVWAWYFDRRNAVESQTPLQSVRQVIGPVP